MITNPIFQIPVLAGGAGTPGGDDTQVQFNDGGSFAGSALTYDKTNHVFYFGQGTLQAAAADKVQVISKDYAAGDTRFYIQSEAGNQIILGNNELQFYNAIGANYERGFFRWDTNVFKIGNEKGAGGTPRDLTLLSTRQINLTATTGVNLSGTSMTFDNQMLAPAGDEVGVDITATVNKMGNNYTSLRVSAYEVAAPGSGNRLLTLGTKDGAGAYTEIFMFKTGTNPQAAFNGNLNMRRAWAIGWSDTNDGIAYQKIWGTGSDALLIRGWTSDNIYLGFHNGAGGTDTWPWQLTPAGLVISTPSLAAATGNEIGHDLSVVVNKQTSGNYTGLRLAAYEQSAPGAANRLLSLGTKDSGGTYTEKAFVDNTGKATFAGATLTNLAGFLFATAGAVSAKSVAETLAALFIPTGMEMLWPTETVPAGWLEEDGSSLARTGTYADLFAVIGTMYGTADESHFNLPDMRGKFPRIWAHGSVNDPDRASRTAPAVTGATISAGDHVGTEQTDTLKAHTHIIATDADVVASGSTYRRPDGGGTNVTSGSTGGNETRPINTYRMMIIKY